MMAEIASKLASLEGEIESSCQTILNAPLLPSLINPSSQNEIRSHGEKLGCEAEIVALGEVAALALN
jgi:hypothetical protein